MYKYKKTNLVLALTFLITVFFQGFVKAEIIKWTNCKTIEDPSAESMWKMFQETEETKIPFDKEQWLKDKNEKYEYINRTFDTKKKILIYERKEKGKELFTKNPVLK